MPSCKFSLVVTFFILLQALSILIGFLKKIAWQNFSNKQKISDKLLFLILVMHLLISYVVISEIDTL